MFIMNYVKMTKLKLFFFFIIIFQNFYSQNKTTVIDSIITDARNNIAPVNPTKAVSVLLDAKSQSKNIEHKLGIMKSSYTLMLLYYNEGNYGKVVDESLDTEKSAKENSNNEYLSDVYRMRANSYIEMSLNKEALNEIKKALPYVEKIEDADIKHYKKALIYESFASIFNKNKDYIKEIEYRYKSVEESKKIHSNNKNRINAKQLNLALQYSSLALAYKERKEKDSTLKYFTKAQEIYENKKYNLYNDGRAYLYSDLALFHYENKDYDKAIKFAKNAEAIEKQSSLPYIRKNVYKILFDSYTEKNEMDSSKYYLKLYTSLNDSILLSEKKSIYKPVNQIISDKEIEKNRIVFNVILITVISSITFLLLGWFFWKKKNKTIHKDYQKLINKLKDEHKISLDIKTTKSELSNIDVLNSEKEKTVQISDSTVNALLKKLEKFEKSNLYLKSNIGLNYLSNFLDANHRYVSEIIKVHKGKTFSNYINDLRIDYITNVLYEDPKYRKYKISYLAEICGFSSREVFATAFKKRNNISPSYVIDILNLENSDGN